MTGWNLPTYMVLYALLWCWHFLHNFLHSFPWRTVSILCRNYASARSLFHWTHFTSSLRPQNISQAKRLTSYVPASSYQRQMHSDTVRKHFPTLGRTTIHTLYIRTYQFDTTVKSTLRETDFESVSKVANNVCKKKARILRGPQTKVSTSSFYLPKSCHPLPEIRNDRVTLMILEGFRSNLAFLVGTFPASA
jgi:hypothetical protein